MTTEDYVSKEVALKMQAGNPSVAPLPTFTKESDNFALAIHIFRVLMNGCHPFAACTTSYRSSVSAPSPPDGIMKGETPFINSSNSMFTIPKYAPEFSSLPPYIQDLFKRAFVDGTNNPRKRPEPTEWRQALVKFRSELKACSNVPFHQYYKKLSACPLCAADMRMSNMMVQGATGGQINFGAQYTPKVSQAQPNKKGFGSKIQAKKSRGRKISKKPIAAVLVVLALVVAGFVLYEQMKPPTIYVESAQDLADFNSSANYVLKNDIDFSGVDWTPKDYSGTFDGNNHEIRGLSISGTFTDRTYGLFSNLSGTIKNVTVVGNVEAPSSGIVAGKSSGTIENVIVKGTVKTINGSSVGGIAGYNSGVIKLCTSEVTVSGLEYVGGIVGSSSWGGKVIECTNNGSVSALANYCGGIVGSGGEVNNSVNTGTVTGKDYTGGLAGNDCSVNNSVNKGKVNGQDNVGGIIGCMQGHSYKYNESLGDVTGSVGVGGFAGYLTEIGNGEPQRIGPITVSGDQKVGGYVGIAVNIYFTANSNDPGLKVIGNKFVGGFIGQLHHGNMSGLTNEAEVQGIASDTVGVGGIIGYWSEGDLWTQTNNMNSCTNNGRVHGTGSGYGGLVGYVDERHSMAHCTFNLDHCVNNGSVSCKGNNVGGLVGISDDSRSYVVINASMNQSSVSGSDYVGGLCGVSSPVTISSNCFNYGTISCSGQHSGDLKP
ncbi:MAG: hypothetical protein WC183_15375 [Methanosarcina sp.]